MDETNLIVVLGLFWDVAGVVILACGLLSLRDKDINHYRSLDGIENIALDLFVQRVDTAFGLFALVVGFLLQALGALKITLVLTSFWIGIGLLTFFVALFVVKHRAAVKQKQELGPEYNSD
ncbi:MAG: hypothetical protein CMM61_12305 [Rhodospirillaceae bacterium]|nr:hypothetical protein [Rhodospirillaceae bacterium]